MNILEVIAVISGLICVWFTVKENIWTFPTGILTVSLYFVVFYQSKLYADMGLQIAYVALNAYGWYEWLHGGKGGDRLHISHSPWRTNATLFLIGVIATALLGSGLSRYTDAALPYWDSSQTVMSLIAQWMMARKYLENWIVWIGVNISSIGMYFYKELHLTTILYGVFLVMATIGFFEWRRTLHRTRALEPQRTNS